MELPQQPRRRISPPSRPVSFSRAQKNRLGISLTAAWQPNDKCARLYNYLRGFTNSTQSPTHKFLNPQGSQNKTKKTPPNWGDVSFTAALYNLISSLTASDISGCTTVCDCIHKRGRAAGSCSHLHAQRSPRHTWEWFSEQCGSLMNPEHRFRFNNPNWRDYRSGKTSAPPRLHFNPNPSSSPSLPPSSSSLLSSTPPPHSLYWPRDPLPHITYGSSVRRKGDLTANLAWDGPWRWGPSTSQRIPIFSWLPPSSPLFSLLLPTPPFLFLFFFLLIIGAGEHVRQESADEEQGRQTLSVHDLVDTCRMICGGRK